jgi:endonuclease/exonuclease/phosphatase (EEP) superfamily protein YafD
MFSRILAAAVILLTAAALLVLLWPQLFGLAGAPVIAQAVSLRGAGIAVALVLVVALTLAALIIPGARRFLASLAVVLLGFSVVSVAVLASRGFGNTSFETATASDVTVLAWNTLGDEPGASVIADLALETEADVVSLPETTRATGREVAETMTAAGRPMQYFTTAYDEVSKAKSTSLLISTELGEYYADEELVTTAVLPSIIASPIDGTGPRIIAVHSVAPVPGEMQNWREDLQWLKGACSGDNVIMAGDFNSTIDHYTGLGVDGGTIGECVDAAVATDNGAVGTWPTSFPSLVGSPIDRILATENWRVTGMRVIQSHDGYGSDHRPVLAQLSPSASG